MSKHITWHMKPETQHLTPEIWNLTPDTWHLTYRGWWLLFPNVRSLALMTWEWMALLEIFTIDQLIRGYTEFVKKLCNRSCAEKVFSHRCPKVVVKQKVICPLTQWAISVKKVVQSFKVHILILKIPKHVFVNLKTRRRKK